MSLTTAIALVLAFASTVLTNLAYLREHDAAAALPRLSTRRPLHSAHMLFADRRWMWGFAMESAGFMLYAAAVGLASLALVQSLGAGGIGVLAFVSARMSRRKLSRRELSGVMLSVLGLAALGVSLAGGSGEGGRGATGWILVWLAASAAAAWVVLALGRRVIGVAVANGIAGGVFFAIGDVSTKVATEGGWRAAFIVTLIVGYTLGTARLQLGYQAGGALTVAGLATLLTNALPIAAGTVVLHEPIPGGALGALRVLAFVALSCAAFLLARPDGQRTSRPRHLTRRDAAGAAPPPRPSGVPRGGGRAEPASPRGRS